MTQLGFNCYHSERCASCGRYKPLGELIYADGKYLCWVCSDVERKLEERKKDNKEAK